MPDVMTTTTVVANDTVSEWIARQMYRLAEQQLVVGRFATRYTLPQRMGTVLQAVRVGRLNLPTGTLTEGVPPDAVALTVSNVQVTVQQWGLVVLLTDVAEITTVHPMLRIAIERVSLAMSEMFEREMYEVLSNGLAGATQRTFQAGDTTRSGLASTDLMITSDVLTVVAQLRNRGAAPIEGQQYGGVLPPQVEADLLSETGANAFAAAVANAARIERLDFAKIANWMGVSWHRSNFMPRYSGTTAPASSQSAEDGTIQTGAGSGGSYAASSSIDPNVVIVARQVANDYERKISQASGNVTTTAGGTFDVTTPTSTNYVYDVYAGTSASLTTITLVQARVAANTTITVLGTHTGTTLSTDDIPADTVDVYTVFVFGKDAFGRVELNGMSLRSYLTPAGPSYSNPLAQGRKVGAKVMWRSFTLDTDFYEQFECASARGQNFPA